MSITRVVVATAVAAVAALCASPALAVGPPADPGAGHRPDTPSTSTTNEQADTGGTDDAGTPGPDASAKTKGKAYGRYCQGQSKRHVHGEKGTPFSRCVTAMAKVATKSTDSPRRACSGLSKRHVHGEKGTPFSRCVRAAARLKHAQDDGSTGDDQPAANDDAEQTA